MPRILAWSTAALSARADVADRLVAKGLKLALRPITADISQIVTAATAPPPPQDAPELAPPPAAPAPTVALLGLEGIAATWGAFVDQELFPYVVQTFLDSTSDIAGDLTAALGDVIMPVGNAYAEEYLAQTKNRLKNISDLLWQSTRDELVFGMEQGYDMSQMAAAVKKAAGVAEPRAMVIARTEVVGAANAGSIIQMRAAGFEPGTVTKEWLATHDTRTRPAHLEADGQSVDLDAMFTVGGESLDRPLDPNGSPGNTIDCRCAMAFDFVDAPLTAAKDFDESMVKRDSEGKFAKKNEVNLQPDFGDWSNVEKSDYINSITPEQWHAMNATEQKYIEDEADDLEAIDFDGSLGVAGHIDDLKTSEPDNDGDTDVAVVPPPPPVPPAPAHNGVHKPINTKTVYKDVYTDGAVVAVSGNGDIRLRWDAPAKKFLLQMQDADGVWKTQESLGKGETYNKFKNDKNWFEPITPVATPAAPTVTTSPAPIASPGGPEDVVPGSLLGDPSLVKMSSIGKTYKGLELDMTDYGAMPILDAEGNVVGYLKSESTAAGKWSYTPLAGAKQDFNASNTNAALAHAGEKILSLNPQAGTKPTPTVVPSPIIGGPVGLPVIPIGEAVTTNSGYTASTSPVDPVFGHVIQDDTSGKLIGYVKQVSGTPPKWVHTAPNGKQSVPFIANYLHIALSAIKNGSDGKGNSTWATQPPSALPDLPGEAIGGPPTNPLSSTSLPSLSAFAPGATASAPATSVPSLPSTATHKKKLLNTKTIYKDTHKHNEVVAVNQLGERLLWNENFKKFQLQAITSDGQWSNKGFFGKGEAFKKFGKDTHWFAPNASDTGTGTHAPTPTLAPAPNIPPTAPSISVPAAPVTAHETAALIGIDVPMELLPPPAPAIPVVAPPPPPIPTIEGIDADISGLSASTKLHIPWNAKALPTQTPLKNFKGALDALNAVGETANLAQILAVLDAKNVQFGGEPGFYTKQIVEWLKTPAGKKAAQKTLIDIAEAKKKPGSGVLSYQKGVTLNPYVIGTPDTSVTVFPKRTNQYMTDIQAKQPKWTAAQRSALKAYTGSTYTSMNTYLRTGVGAPMTKQLVEDAQAGMRPLPTSLVVSRGTSSFFGDATPSLEQLQKMVGVTVREKGFLSTAVAASGFGGQYKLEIEVPAGTPAAFVYGISSYKNESELLLAAGLKYQIISVSGTGYQKTVRMRVVS